ncbi:MAG: VWA domain-containing protein [Candidatus Thorarchaeota archaeon]
MIDRDNIPLVAALIVVVFVGATVFDRQIAPATFSGQPKVLSDAGKIDPYEVSIHGSIMDNYANLSYQMMYDNYGSSTDNEVDWFLGLDSGLRLSNISVLLDSVVYWGRVFPEQQAIQIYNDSVEANKSAVLVQRSADGYSVKMNVEAGKEATLTIFVEGLLTRKFGLYSLGLPVGRNGIVNTGFSFNFDIISHFTPVAGYSVRGLPSLTVTDITDGIRLEYSTATLTIEERIEVIYSLDRQLGGAQLLTHTNGSDNFFVYLLAPSITEDAESARRQYVFVLDKSGSMGGTKMEQAKTAFSTMVGTLRSIDMFNVISFDHDIDDLWTEPHTATASNIETAQSWIQALTAGGSTNFHGAAMRGLSTFTEGENAKAMLILSDGLPTAGEITSSTGILSAINEANTLDVSIATVAFGSDSDENLMANIAAQNDGFFVFIEPDEDASTKLLDFYKTFSTPVADNYEISFAGALEVVSLCPLGESPFFNGSEIVVSGLYVEGMTVTTSIDYVSGPATYTDTVGAASVDNEHVEFIWAQQRITYLLDWVAEHGETDALRNQIVDMGMQYGIAIADYTAMVLTAYDADSIEESTTTDGTYTTTGPPRADPPDATTGTYAATPAPSGAFDSTLSVVAGAFGLIGILGLGTIVLLISKYRRGK